MMRIPVHLLPVTFIFCCVSHLAILPNARAIQSQKAKDAQPEKPKSPPLQDSELTEASRLSESVVKLYAEGKYEEALPLAKRALEIRQRLLSPDDELLALTLTNLAEVQLARRKPDEARSLFERALKTYERTLGEANVKVSDVLDRLAVAYYGMGSPANAEKAYERSLSIREKALGSQHPEVAQAVYHLAEYYQFQGDYKKAEPLYRRLLEIRTKTSADRASIVEAIDRYACLLRKDKRAQEADQLEERESAALHLAEDSSQWIVGGVVNGKALNLVQPLYPNEARAARASGKVSVRVLISETGNVLRVCAFEGPRLLMKASESAAARSKFSPTTVEGKPVKVTGVIIYNYIAQ